MMGVWCRSKVIDTFSEEHQKSCNAEKLAYFYCNRAEESRRDPESILNTLILQLAQADGGNILEPVIDLYQDRHQIGQTRSPLTLRESQELLVQLTDIYPQTTICIDALDEVDSKIRLDLLKSLKQVIGKSKNLVKIFATSRNDVDIVRQFEIFPKIDVQPDDNEDDINEFITKRVASVVSERQLLDGKVNCDFEKEICKVLRTRSRGM
jgi:hypothetical protein